MSHRLNFQFVSSAIAISVLLALSSCSGQKPPATPPPAATERAAPAPLPPDVWVSETTGKQYRVHIDKGKLNADWYNVPAALFERGAYMRTECRKVGKAWVGVTRSYLPCSEGEGVKEHIANWCHLTTKIEFNSVTPETIAGRGESLQKFNCEACKVVETSWGNFVWVPAAKAKPAPATAEKNPAENQATRP